MAGASSTKNHKVIEGELTHKDGVLYWKGKKIRTTSALSKGQKFFGGFVALLSVLGLVSGVAGGALNLNKEYCFIKSAKSCVEAEASNEAATVRDG